MKKFEYKTIVLDAKGILGGKIKPEEFDSVLNAEGRKGWELVQSTSSNQDFGSTRYIICILKRELS